MGICCCSLAGTEVCKTCSNNNNNDTNFTPFKRNPIKLGY